MPNIVGVTAYGGGSQQACSGVMVCAPPSANVPTTCRVIGECESFSPDYSGFECCCPAGTTITSPETQGSGGFVDTVVKSAQDVLGFVVGKGDQQYSEEQGTQQLKNAVTNGIQQGMQQGVEETQRTNGSSATSYLPLVAAGGLLLVAIGGLWWAVTR